MRSGDYYCRSDVGERNSALSRGIRPDVSSGPPWKTPARSSFPCSPFRRARAFQDSSEFAGPGELFK
jgi:hypothetical protein